MVRGRVSTSASRQRFPETHGPLDLLIAHRSVRGDAAGVVQLSVARDFAMAPGACARFGGVHQGAANALPAHRRLDVPALDKRYRRRRAAWCVVAVIELEKSDQPAAGVRDEDNRPFGTCFKIPSRFNVVIRERTRPQRVTQAHPVGAVVFGDVADLHTGSERYSRARPSTDKYARQGPTASVYWRAITRTTWLMCPRSCATHVA